MVSARAWHQLPPRVVAGMPPGAAGPRTDPVGAVVPTPLATRAP